MEKQWATVAHEQSNDLPEDERCEEQAPIERSSDADNSQGETEASDDLMLRNHRRPYKNRTTELRSTLHETSIWFSFLTHTSLLVHRHHLDRDWLLPSQWESSQIEWLSIFLPRHSCLSERTTKQKLIISKPRTTPEKNNKSLIMSHALSHTSMK